MPPRVQQLQRLGTVNLCLRPAAKPATPNFLPITQTANLSLREKKRKAKQDPYGWAQAQQRKNANLKRRQELETERAKEWGDPIWGKPTPFLESLESAGQETQSKEIKDAEGNVLQESHPLPTAKGMRNYFLTDAELNEATQHAHDLTRPELGTLEAQMGQTQEENDRQHALNHNKATEAMRRITALENGSARDRRHANVRRIIEEFGRHQTDLTLKPKPQGMDPFMENPTARAGPDTGSNEVQIAVLTMQIRNMATTLQNNKKDKHGKRNLRLLLHKRQKLLKYMERAERGSERWTNMIAKLGLTPAAWKSQISL